MSDFAMTVDLKGPNFVGDVRFAVGDRVTCSRSGEIGTVEFVRAMLSKGGERLPTLVGFKTDDGRGLVRDEGSLQKSSVQ